MNLDTCHQIFQTAHDEGRKLLYEHEVYDLLRALEIDTPRHVFLPQNTKLQQTDLTRLKSEKLVLKIVSPTITHKTDVGGVRFVENEPNIVQAAIDTLYQEVPLRYYDQTLCSGTQPEIDDDNPSPQDDIKGILIIEQVSFERFGLGSEILIGLRWTREFGHVYTFGAGGVDTELLNLNFREGAGFVIGSTQQQEAILDNIARTAVFGKLTGHSRDKRRFIDESVLVKTLQALCDLANHYSSQNPDAKFLIREMEVNPFVVADGRLIALDGLLRFETGEYHPAMKPLSKIERLLKPQSAAIIGVSRKLNMGHIILNNLIEKGFDKAHLYIVKDGDDTIEDVRCYPSVAELPEKVDMFIVAIGAGLVPGLVKELVAHDRAHSVILIPGGMGEKEGGENIEQQMRDTYEPKRAQGEDTPVFCGGNSLGVVSQPGRYDTLFIPEYKLPVPDDGIDNTAIISQSGAFMITRMSNAAFIKPYYGISAGNQLDLTVADYLEYVVEDPHVEVVLCYVEAFKPLDGLKFARVARQARRNGKDILVYKAGRTPEGRSATAGHTAAVAGDYQVAKAILAASGVFVASSFEEVQDALMIFALLRGRVVRGNRLGAMSNAGYEAVGIADNLSGPGYTFHLASFTDDCMRNIEKVLEESKLSGLVDVHNPADITPMAGDEANALVFKAILEDSSVDCTLFADVPLTPALNSLAASDGHSEDITRPDSFVSRIITLYHSTDKPMVVSIDSGKLFDAAAEVFLKARVPCFRSADRAIRALGQYVNLKLGSYK